MNKKISGSRNIFCLFYGTAVSLLIGFYYNDPFVFHHFHALRFILYVFVPVTLNFFILKIPLQDLGVRIPNMSPGLIKYVWFFIILSPLLFLVMPFLSSYLAAYPQYQNNIVPWQDKALRFSIFTLSTLPGWEFIHRGFLLFGLKYTLLKSKLDETSASVVAVCSVALSEALYHTIKPDIEAFGMLALSPILSWFALKTKSIWIPFALHLYIEFLFFLQICHFGS